MPVISQLVPLYIQDRRMFHSSTENTVKQDMATLRQFIREVGDIQPQHVTTAHVRKLGAIWSQQAATTQNARVGGLRMFYKWCRQQKHVPRDFDPFSMIRHRPLSTPVRRRVPAVQFPLLLDSVDHPRDRVFLAMGLWTLLRGTDLTGLRVKDLNLEDGYLAVAVQKSKVNDSLPLLPALTVELERWLAYYASECGPLQPDWYLVPSTHDAACPRDPDTGLYMVRRGVHRPKIKPELRMKNVERVVHRALTALGMPVEGHREGGHTLRRSGARAYYDVLSQDPVHGRRALRAVMALLHHKSVMMTERYLGLEEDRLHRDEVVHALDFHAAVAATSSTGLRRVK